MTLSNDRLWPKSLVILFLLVLFVGCAPERVAKKEPFFEKWDTLAKESQGHSPVSNRRISVYPELTSKEGETKENGKDDRADTGLPQERITLKMRQADIKTVIRALARASNKNILLRNEIKGEVDIDFTNVPWNQAFDSILRAQGLSYVWDGEIIRVLSLDDMEHSLKLSEIQGKHDIQVMEAKRVEPLITMVISVDYADPQALRDNLQDFLTRDKDGKATMGSIKVDQGSNSLIIQASRNDINRMQPIIEKIDVPIHQINIKANIVETTKEIARDLGVQWGGVHGSSVGGSSLFVMPGGTGLPLTPGVNPLPGGTFSPTSVNAGISGQGYGVNFPAAGMDSAASASLGLIFGTIGGNILEAQLSALQKDSKLNILSSPSITTLNNQTAYTENGERVPYLSQETSGGAITNTVKFEDAVLRLEIKPHVIDNKTLKMDILVKKNQVDTTRDVQGNPFIIKKETKTSLIVQDGETIVISGLSKEINTYKTAGVPGLKNIPGLGWLFKNEGKADQMEEVLIFITPRILPPHVVSAAQPQEKSLQAAP